MKQDVIYQSRYSSRQWRLSNNVLQTKSRTGSLWRPAGWPEPEMSIRDVDYYIESGEFFEVTE